MATRARTGKKQTKRRRTRPEPGLDARDPRHAHTSEPVITLSGGAKEVRRPRNPCPSGVRCLKPKKGGGKCQLEAGWGTDHKGIGPCKLHGGDPLHTSGASANTQAEQRRRRVRGNHQANQELSHLLGYEVEIDPVNAMLACIRITYGEVLFWDEKLRELDAQEEEWFVDTMVGKQIHHYAKQKQIAVDRLAKYSSQAMTLGIAERALRLAEAYGSVLAQLFRVVMQDLLAALPPTQAANYHRRVLTEAAESILPRRLAELDQAYDYSLEANAVIEGEYQRLAE